MEVRKLASRDTYRKKRVAAYARVSTLQECQEDSFDTQIKYYETLIRNTPSWQFAKVYSDHGFSGVSAERRPGFMEMVQDARCREFDVLLVRSISRFARNAREAQLYCREMKTNGIEVYFEKERISGSDPTSELVFNLLASCAQEESRATSERTKWSIHKMQEHGVLHIGDRALGYKEVNGVLVPTEESWVVREIFERYTHGESMSEIAENINKTGFIRAKTQNALTRSHVYYILGNPLYVGDRLLQKQPPKNYMTHRPDPSQGYNSYYAKNTHDGIVSREVWDKAQGRLKTAHELLEAGVRPHRDSHFLYGKIFCGACGCPMKRKLVNSRRKPECEFDRAAVWKCADRLKGKNGAGCKTDTIKESDLIIQICRQLGVEFDNLKESAAQIERVVVEDGGVKVFTFDTAPKP